MARALLTFASSLLLVTTLASCDSGGDNGNGSVQPGTYSASVTGHVSTSLSGPAVSTGTTAQWGVVLSPGASQTITLVTTGTGRPAEGSYVIRRTTFEGGPVLPGQFFGSIVLEGMVSYTMTSGTLTLASSTPTRVTGSFSFVGDRFNGEIVTVEGSFNATNTEG